MISDISRQLESYLDQCALYGTGGSGNQPLGLTGIAGVNQGVAITPTDLLGSFCAVEQLIEGANVSMDFYGVLVSPATKKKLRTTPSFTGGSITAWGELRNPQSSPEIVDGKCFCGAWNNMTFCVWGRGIEILVDPFSLADSNQVKLKSALFADVGVRYPNAFAVTAAV